VLVDALERKLEVLDRIDDSVIVLCPLYADDKPPRDLAALVDWRTGGALARAFVDDPSLAQVGSVRRFAHERLGGASVFVVGHGLAVDEAGLGVIAAALDDALRELEAKPYRVFTEWPTRLREEESLAELWLAPLLTHLSTSRLCLVGNPAVLEAVHRLVLRAERRLIGKSEPFAFPSSFGGEAPR
jgi:hypothetical protein